MCRGYRVDAPGAMSRARCAEAMCEVDVPGLRSVEKLIPPRPVDHWDDAAEPRPRTKTLLPMSRDARETISGDDLLTLVKNAAERGELDTLRDVIAKNTALLKCEGPLVLAAVLPDRRSGEAASGGGALDAAAAVLEAGAPVPQSEGPGGAVVCALLDAAAAHPGLIEILLRHGMSPDATDSKGVPAVALARTPGAARALVEAGANLGLPWSGYLESRGLCEVSRGALALLRIRSTAPEALAAVRILLSAWVDRRELDDWVGRRLMSTYLAGLRPSHQDFYNVRSRAANHSDIVTVLNELAFYGARDNRSGHLLLQEMQQGNHESVEAALTIALSDPNCRLNGERMSPLWMAVNRPIGQFEGDLADKTAIVELLLERGARPHQGEADHSSLVDAALNIASMRRGAREDPATLRLVQVLAAAFSKPCGEPSEVTSPFRPPRA